jgi:hypothetical protein
MTHLEQLNQLQQLARQKEEDYARAPKELASQRLADWEEAENRYSEFLNMINERRLSLNEAVEQGARHA